MLRVAALVLAVSMWPFHKKHENPPPPPPPAQAENVPVPVLPSYITDLCLTMNDGTVFFYGPDGAIGVGPSCLAALLDWNHETPPRPLMSIDLKR